MTEAGIPKHVSSPREPKIPHSLLIQIHCINRRRNTKQVKVSFRNTLKGIYGKFEVGTEREWIQPFAWRTKYWNRLKEQDAIFNTACPQRWWHSVLVNHYTIDGHGNWCIPFAQQFHNQGSAVQNYLQRCTEERPDGETTCHSFYLGLNNGVTDT